MIRAHSNLGAEHVNSVKQQVRKYHVGSMCFFQGTPEGHATLINQYQEISLVPIMMAIDAEWGGGMRFKEHAMSFPRQLTLGAIEDNTAIYDMGLEIGRQLRQIGIHVNFAPVVDINVNPANPVINDRSFGEDRYDVTAKSFQYMKGLQDAGVMACAKHCPGHGDTDVDSHLDLPVINHSRSRLDSVEMYPFEILINKGLQSIMIAHLQVPALDQRPNMPTSLSPYVIDTILRQQMLFDGLIFTDALEMKGVTKHRGTGKLAVEAFLAGNDVIVLPEDIDAEFQAMQNAVEAGIISQQRLEISVKRILRSKAELGLFGSENANTGADLFPPEAIALKQRLYEHSVTVVANTDNILPIGDVDNRQITSLVIGSTSKTNFQERLN